MKSLQILATVFMLNICSYAQSTTLILPTTDNTSNFRVTNGSATLMNLNGDAGFYLGGTFGVGTIPKEGTGPRLMWYPAKAAFRAGNVTGSEWNDEKIGNRSVAMGNNAEASGAYSTAIGSWTVASGNSSTAIGTTAIASGFGSTAMGTNVSTNSMLGSFVIGDRSSGTAFLSSTAEHQMSMRFAGGYMFYSNAGCTIGMSLEAGGNSWASISDSTKKENIIKADGEYFLSSLAKLRLGSWNYKTQNPQQFRHYGPMAQEIFHYFGKDEFGVIGNDTTLASADMDGIMMICLQALEKRTEELQTANGKCEMENETLKKEIAGLRNDIEELKTLVAGITKEKSENLVSK